MDQAQDFEVHPFSINKLIELITNAAADGTTQEQIAAKAHLNYFEGYFDALAAQTIIVEHDYIDRYYTEDFSEYYVRCFQHYKKTCTRLHFFATEIAEEGFISLLSREDDTYTPDDLQKHYLGFVVIKPLPKTVIGRTCLKTYPHDGRRYYPITRSYKVNLFGLQLEAENTLAFQEQDSVVAACATSALWSVFHGTGILFQHQILSPSQITKQATKHAPVSKRTFPNEGLTSEMMALAIRSVSLEPSLEGIPNLYWLKCTLYAYMKAKIPMILGMGLHDSSNNPSKFMGKHAVAATGFSLGLNTPQQNPDPSFGRLLLTAGKIDKIYAHDDQVGPFSRMTFDNNSFISQGPRTITESMATNFPSDTGTQGYVRAVPELLLIPLYHKIRIPFIAIYRLIANINALIEYLTNHALDAIEWDIFLSQANDWKSELHQSQEISGDDLKNILVERTPRFIWRAIASTNGNKEFELIFDATDIGQGNFFLRTVRYQNNLSATLNTLANTAGVDAILKGRPAEAIFTSFK